MNPQKKKMMFFGGAAILIVIAIVAIILLQEPEPSPSPIQTAAPTAAPTLAPLDTGRYTLSDIPCSEIPEKHHIDRELNRAECEKSYQQFTGDPNLPLTTWSETNPSGNIGSMVNKPSGCSYCDRDNGCSAGLAANQPFIQKGIVYFNENEDVSRQNVIQGNKYVCFDKSVPQQSPLPVDPLSATAQAALDRQNAEMEALQARVDAAEAVQRLLESRVPVNTVVDENPWGVNMEGDSLINNVPTSEYFQKLYAGHTTSETSLTQLTDGTTKLIGGDEYTGLCGEGNEISLYQCEGTVNPSNSVGKCYTDTTNMVGSCGNSDLCEHDDDTNPIPLINNSATIRVYKIDDIMDGLKNKIKRIRVKGKSDTPPYLILEYYDGEDYENAANIVEMASKEYQYDIKHSSRMELSETDWNTMKNHFNGEEDPPGNIMECPEFGKLITTDIMCNIGKKEVEMMFVFYKLQLDLDGLFSEVPLSKPTGAYRNMFDTSPINPIPKKYQWEWLDMYLLYKEYSAPSDTLWQGSKHHNSTVLTLNKVNWGKDSGQPLNKCGSNHLFEMKTDYNGDGEGVDCEGRYGPEKRNKLVDYGLPDVYHINQRDTRYLLGGHDKASYHKTTKLRHLLHGKHSDDTCGLGFVGILKGMEDPLEYNEYISKFTVFKDGYVKDWITDGPTGHPGYGSGNRNRQSAQFKDGDTLRDNSIIENGYNNTFDLFKNKYRYADRYVKEKLQELNYEISPIFPGIEYKCCDEKKTSSAPFNNQGIQDYSIYDEEYDTLITDKNDKKVLLNPIHWGGLGFRVAGKPSFDLKTTLLDEQSGSINNNKDVQRILPFKLENNESTRMKGVLESVVTLLQDDDDSGIQQSSKYITLTPEEKEQLARLYIWKFILSIDEDTVYTTEQKDAVKELNDNILHTGNPGSKFYKAVASSGDTYGSVRIAETMNDQLPNESKLLNVAELNILYPFGLGILDDAEESYKWSSALPDTITDMTTGETTEATIDHGVIYKETGADSAGTGTDPDPDPIWSNSLEAWILVFEKAGMNSDHARTFITQELNSEELTPLQIRDKIWREFKEILRDNVPKTCAYSDLSYTNDPSLPYYKVKESHLKRMVQPPTTMMDTNEYEYVPGTGDTSADDTSTFKGDYTGDHGNNELMRPQALWATSMHDKQKSVYGFHTLILEPLIYEWGDGFYEEEKSKHSISREKGGLILQKRFGKELNSEELHANADGEISNIREYLNKIKVAKNPGDKLTLEEQCVSFNMNNCITTMGCTWNDNAGGCSVKKTGNNDSILSYNNAWTSGSPNMENDAGSDITSSNKLYAQQCNFVRGGIEDNSCENETDKQNCKGMDTCEWFDDAYSKDYPWAAPPGCWEVNGRNYKVGGELIGDKEISEPWTVDYYNDSMIKSDLELGRNLNQLGSIYPFNSHLQQEYGEASHPDWRDTPKQYDGKQFSNSVICAPKQYHDLNGDDLLNKMYEKNKTLGLINSSSDEDICWRKQPNDCVKKGKNKSGSLIPKTFEGCNSPTGCPDNLRLGGNINNMRPATLEEINNGGVCYSGESNYMPLQTQLSESECVSPNNWLPVTVSDKETYENPHCELREIKPIKKVCKSPSAA